MGLELHGLKLIWEWHCRGGAVSHGVAGVDSLVCKRKDMALGWLFFVLYLYY